MRFLFLCSIISSILIAQEKNHDQQLDNIVLFSINHTFHTPGGDLKKRFGNNSSISCVLSYKDKNTINHIMKGMQDFFDKRDEPEENEPNILGNVNLGEGYVDKNS